MLIKKSVPKTAHMTLKESMIRLLSSTERFGKELLRAFKPRFGKTCFNSASFKRGLCRNAA